MSKSVLSNVEDNFETSTSYIIHKSNLTKTAYMNLRSKLSIIEYRTEEEIPKAFFEKGDYIFIPKINANMLNFITSKPLMFKRMINDHLYIDNMYKLKWKPLEHQVKLIEDGVKQLTTSMDKRLCICLAPGLGKTFCTSAILSKLQCKFLFLVYSTKIIDQSIKAMTEHLGEGRFYKLKHSADIHELNYDKIQGLFMTHSMFKTIVKNIGIEEFNEILFGKIGINMKVLDEFDREVNNMYYMDAMMGFRYSIYLTGTKFKSLKPDDRLFQLVFRNVKTVGLDVKLTPNKDIIFVHFNYNPSGLEYSKIMRGGGTFKTYYNNYLAQKDVLLDYMMMKFWQDDSVNKEKNDKKLFKRMIAEGGQIQFFVSRIDNCDIVKEKLINRFGLDPEDVGIVNSSINNKEKAKNIDKTWLVTTSQSLGRGVDSDKVRVLVLLEFHFSLSEMIQMQSRVGRIGKKFGYFIYPVDHSFTKVMRSYNSKVSKGIWREGFKNNYHLQVPIEYVNDYINGYDKDSKQAKEIMANKLKHSKKLVSKEITKTFSHYLNRK